MDQETQGPDEEGGAATRVDAVVILLERIAIALESIAGERQRVETCEPRRRTAFPWDRVSVRCRKHLRSAVERNFCDTFTGYKWPLSCEDLMSLGYDYLVNEACVRNWSHKSANEINPILIELGFENWLTK